MPTVRTTLQPHLNVEVSDSEYTDLQRQGLLIEDQSAAAAAPVKSPATAKSSKE